MEHTKDINESISTKESHGHIFLEKLGICNQDTCVNKFIFDEYLQNQMDIVQFFIIYWLGIRVNLKIIQYIYYMVGYYHCNTVPIMFMEGTY